VLKVPDNVKTAQLSCPRCLAKFDNPASTAEEPPLTVTLAEPASSGVCPRCGDQVEPAWRYCPHCHATLRGPNRGKVANIVDDDVRRDTKGTNVVLILLAVLGGLGLFFYLSLGLSSLQQGSGQVLIAIILSVLFLTLLTTGIMFWRTRDDPSRRGIGRVILGTLAMTGVLFVLSCGIGMAMIIYFFVACLTSLPGGFH
jgi:hypothetical protein